MKRAYLIHKYLLSSGAFELVKVNKKTTKYRCVQPLCNHYNDYVWVTKHRGIVKVGKKITESMDVTYRYSSDTLNKWYAFKRDDENVKCINHHEID